MGVKIGKFIADPKTVENFTGMAWIDYAGNIVVLNCVFSRKAFSQNLLLIDGNVDDDGALLKLLGYSGVVCVVVV